MRSVVWSSLPIAALLLQLSSLSTAHGQDGHSGTAMAGMRNSTAQGHVDAYDLPRYAGLSSNTKSILAHVIFEVLAWFFVLPIGG